MASFPFDVLLRRKRNLRRLIPRRKRAAACEPRHTKESNTVPSTSHEELSTIVAFFIPDHSKSLYCSLRQTDNQPDRRCRQDHETSKVETSSSGSILRKEGRKIFRVCLVLSVCLSVLSLSLSLSLTHSLTLSLSASLTIRFRSIQIPNDADLSLEQPLEQTQSSTMALKRINKELADLGRYALHTIEIPLADAIAWPCDSG